MSTLLFNCVIVLFDILEHYARSHGTTRCICDDQHAPALSNSYHNGSNI